MKKYFANIKTAEELKKAYKRLCLQLHPDKGGDPAEFKAMQAEYEEAAQRIAHGEAAGNYQHNKKQDGTYKTAEEILREQKEFAEVLEKLIGLEGLDLEICGNWLWIGGNTYQHKDIIKAVGAKWANKKKLWYWHAGEWVKKIRKTLTMDENSRPARKREAATAPRLIHSGSSPHRQLCNDYTVLTAETPPRWRRISGTGRPGTDEAGQGKEIKK